MTVTNDALKAIAWGGMSRYRRKKYPMMHGVQTTWSDVKDLSDRDLAANLFFFRESKGRDRTWDADLRALEAEWVRRELVTMDPAKPDQKNLK